LLPRKRAYTGFCSKLAVRYFISPDGRPEHALVQVAEQNRKKAGILDLRLYI